MFGLSKLRLKRHSHPVFVEDEPLAPKPVRRVRLRFPLLLMLSLLLAGWSYHRAHAETHHAMNEQVVLDAVEAGQLLLKSEDDSHFITAVTQASKVHIKVSGMVAHVSLEQTFRNHSQHWVEGVYAFPLPDKAAVNRMQMVIGERVIEGTIKEKAEAKKIYNKAKSQGKKAGLVKQQRPNLFTTKIANISPNETITVKLEYIESITYDQGRFSLRFPMTITPRYMPGSPLPIEDHLQFDDRRPLHFTSSALGWAMNTDQVPDANEISPWMSPDLPTETNPINPITLTAELDMGMPLQSIESAYHNITSSRQGNNYQVRLSEGSVSMTQDFSLTWQPVIGNAPKAAIFSEQVKSEDYALLMMVPPVTKTSPLAKEAIYIIDTSGSMDGVSIRQARDSLLYALDQLGPQDRFNVIAFNSTTDMLFGRAVPASKDNLKQARRYVSRLQSGGGTEMLPALHAALKDRAPEGFVRQVMFITDGAVGNETALFESIHQQLGNSRLFTVGIGSAPNSYFMRKAAQFGRGSFTHIGRVSEVRQKMTELFTKLNNPVISNISVRWPNSKNIETYPSRIPDLYHGEPLLVTAKLSDLQGDIVISGQTADENWQQTITIDAVQQHSGVATLWAREKIASLLDEKITGRDESAVRKDVLSVALTHQLLSPYTSFVAVEKIVSRPADKKQNTAPVLNARPEGQGPQSFAYPQTATGAMQSLLWGLLFLITAFAFRFCSHKEAEYELVG